MYFMICNDELNKVPMTHDWDTAVIHNQLRFSEKKYQRTVILFTVSETAGRAFPVRLVYGCTCHPVGLGGLNSEPGGELWTARHP